MILQQYGPFVYSNEAEELDMKFKARELRPKKRLTNNSHYVGEWQEGTDIREGRGMNVWSDGSIYEGYWRDNKATYFGRLIHKDGDVYQGEWLDDKAHGFGYYMHIDGSLYRGFWQNDV